METKLHLRARALVCHGGKFLVIRMKNGSHSFLQGGHIETGESIPETIRREMVEECGRACVVKEYLGAIEHSWEEGEVINWEINHVFHVEIADLDKNPEIKSLDERFDFIWISSDEFENVNMLPIPIRGLMKKWEKGDKATWWGSSMDVKKTD